jgi:hypothetical protein
MKRRRTKKGKGDSSIAETVVGNKMCVFTVRCVNDNSFVQGNVNMTHKVNADMLGTTEQFYPQKNK